MFELDLKIIKLEIRASFIALVFFALLTGEGRRFFILAACLLAHEASHAAAARMFGIKTSALSVAPLGFAARMEYFDFLEIWEKLVILFAGCLCNAVFVAAGLMISGARGWFLAANVLIICANLTPAAPLDGGRILRCLLEPRLGVIPAAKLAGRLGKLAGAALAACGFVLAALFPYNLSLTFCGLYLYGSARKEAADRIYEFYLKLVLSGGKRGLRRALKVRTFYVPPGVKIKELLYKIDWNAYCVFLVDTGDKTAEIGEEALTAGALKLGLGAGAGELVPRE